ncbi:MAG: tetratricopeptide repeat protein [Methanomicrobiales archaeon]|nr:tetratricopeptide repeat protein [Methanomicrobiales archaeon]
MDTVNSATATLAKCPACGAVGQSAKPFCGSCGAQMQVQRVCPHCRAPVAGNPEFCRSCGKPLVPPRKCPKCNAQISGNPEFCRSCGAPLLELRSCPSCGAMVSKSAKFCNGCGMVMGAEIPGMVDEPQAMDYNNRGNELGRLGRYEEALASFDQAIRIKPDLYVAWGGRGIALGNLGRHAEALASFDQVLKINPDLSETWNFRGYALERLDRNNEAVTSYNRALKIDPGNSQAWYNRGIALGNLGRHAEAVESYDQALMISPNDSNAWHSRGIALGNLGRHAEAVASYDKALTIRTNYFEAWVNRGVALYYLGRYDEVLGSYDLALKIKTDDPNTGHYRGLAWHYRGLALSKLGRNSEAIESYDQALDIDPGNSQAVSDRELARSKLTNNAGAVAGTTPSSQNSSSGITPDLFITLDQTTFAQSTWHKMGIQVTNTGKAPAFSVTLSFSDDFETRRIKPITVEAGSTTVVEIGIMPKTLGNIPIEVTLDYKDESNHEYVTTSEFWVEVLSQGYTSQAFKPGTDPGQPAPSSTSQPPPATGNYTMRTIPPEMAVKYAESEFIGKGGFARVFKAKRKDGVYVAVKVPIYLDESTGKSFIAEMQNWTKFSHPNIVKIYDYNIMPFPYFEEELCDSSLDKIKKPLDPAKASWILFNICEGLKYAHARKVIHRDLKPQNILLKSGVPKISDWGLSKVITDSTSSMTAAYTPVYAAPEQVANKTKDQRTDIWQVGVILYELVTGSLPFTGDDMLEILAKIPTLDPVHPGDINPDAKNIEPVILRCIEKDPANRYQSVAELQKDLAVFLKMDFKESLRTSTMTKNPRQTAIFISQLLLTYLKSGDLNEAYKYATDLVNYSDGEVRDQVKELVGQIRMRIDNGLLDEVPDEIINEADLVAHKIGIGLTTL